MAPGLGAAFSQERGRSVRNVARVLAPPDTHLWHLKASARLPIASD